MCLLLQDAYRKSNKINQNAKLIQVSVFDACILTKYVGKKRKK